MTRRGNWPAPLPTVISVGWWLTEKLASGLLPPVRRPLALVVVMLAAAHTPGRLPMAAYAMAPLR